MTPRDPKRRQEIVDTLLRFRKAAVTFGDKRHLSTVDRLLRLAKSQETMSTMSDTELSAFVSDLLALGRARRDIAKKVTLSDAKNLATKMNSDFAETLAASGRLGARSWSNTKAHSVFVLQTLDGVDVCGTLALMSDREESIRFEYFSGEGLAIMLDVVKEEGYTEQNLHL